jgi:hypothetical protein
MKWARHWEIEIVYIIFTEGNYPEDQVVDGRIILKSALRKLGLMVWIEFIWLSRGIDGGVM